MFLGTFQLGQRVPLHAFVKVASRPYAPAAAPLYRVYAGTTLVVTGRMPPVDRGAGEGLFGFNLRLGDDFDTGSYSVLVNYYANSGGRLESHHFRIVPGGDVDGAVVSAYFYQRPHANFIVERLDSNKRAICKNPRIG